MAQKPIQPRIVKLVTPASEGLGAVPPKGPVARQIPTAQPKPQPPKKNK